MRRLSVYGYKVYNDIYRENVNLQNIDEKIILPLITQSWKEIKIQNYSLIFRIHKEFLSITKRPCYQIQVAWSSDFQENIRLQQS